MNTLHDLRATLDQHASAIHDDPTTARVAAVAGRARVVRRRRAAGVGAATVVAVVAAGAFAMMPGDRNVDPAAPQSLTSLGWTYQVADTVETESGRVSTDLEESQLPRLVSWATAGEEQEVRIRYNTETVLSEVADFADFVWLPPGYAGRVSIMGGPGLTLATYELDESRAPDGVGEGALTYREDVAGMELLGAEVGEPGQASIEVDLRHDGGTTAVAYHCENLPSGTRGHLNWVGSSGSLSFGQCDESTAFDPGGSGGFIFSALAAGAGADATMRLWVTREGRPVADGEIPDLRLSLGAYAASESRMMLAGTEMEETIEHVGHVWELEDVATGGPGQLPQIEVPAEGSFLVADAVKARGRVGYGLTVDGARIGTSTVFIDTGGGGGSRQLVDPGSLVSMRFGTPVDRVSAAGLALYRRVD